MNTQAHQSQTTLREPALLRGYDPLKECVQWNTLVGCLAGMLVCISFICSPMILNLTLPAGELWTGIFVFSLVVFFITMCAVPALPLWTRIRREERQRNSWRRGALQGTDPRLVSPQPVTPEWPLSLPSHLESRIRRALLPVIGAGGLIVVAVFIAGYLWISGYTGEPFRALVELFSMILPIIFLPCLGISYLIQMYIAAYYFHPQLHIDNNGITARYGRDTITMAWRDIRYFALINARLSSSGFDKKAPRREAFEVSDGENRVCWLAHQPLSPYRLFSLDETDLRKPDYTKFTQQLAVLIVEYTHLPLLDFRLEEKKQKKRI